MIPSPLQSLVYCALMAVGLIAVVLVALWLVLGRFDKYEDDAL